MQTSETVRQMSINVTLTLNRPPRYIYCIPIWQRIGRYSTIFQRKFKRDITWYDDHAIKSLVYIHTYIIGHYSPSVRIMDLVSHTTYVVCFNFIHKWRRTYSLKTFANDRLFFLETFHGNFILLSRVFVRNLLRGSRQSKSLFVFCFNVWPGTRTLAFRLISQHITY